MLDVQSKPSKQLSFGLTIDQSWDVFDYDFGAPPRYPRVSPAALADPAAPLDPGTGRGLVVTARVEVQPSDSFRLTFHTRNRLVRDDTGLLAFDEKLYSTQALYQLTAFSFARVRADYDSLRENLRGQLLLGWTPIPGTSFYAGYTDDLVRDEEDGLIRNGRTAFLKASYLVRRSWSR